MMSREKYDISGGAHVTPDQAPKDEPIYLSSTILMLCELFRVFSRAK